MAGETGVTGDPLTTFYFLVTGLQSDRPSNLQKLQSSPEWNDPAALQIRLDRYLAAGPGVLGGRGAKARYEKAVSERIDELTASSSSSSPPPSSSSPPPSSSSSSSSGVFTEAGELRTYPPRIDASPYALRDRILRAIERSIFGAKPKPAPRPRRRRAPTRRTKPKPGRPRRRPVFPKRTPAPDVPIRIPKKTPGIPGLIIRTIEDTRKGMAEAIRRRLAKERKGPSSRPPGRPPPEPPALPRGPLSRFPAPSSPAPSSPAPAPSSEPLPELRIPTGPLIQPRPFPEPGVQPRIEPGPIQIPQPPPLELPQPLPSSLPFALPFALPRASPRTAPNLRPGVSPGPGLSSPFAELTNTLPSTNPAQQTERCWVQCRRSKGKKKRKKRKVCVSARQARALGLLDSK